jgi:hypothetical protein
MENGKVYVVHNEWIQYPETGDMPYKIGITKNSVDDRYYGLGLKMPGEFICDFAYEFSYNYAEVERTLHSMLNQLNINGEWFNINEEALDGIKKICELAGGKLITEIVKNEIENATGEEIHPALEKIVSRWNETSDMKTMGKSPKVRNINIPGINKAVRYRFKIRNSRELNIELGCWTQKKYPDIDKLFNEFNGLSIRNHTFKYTTYIKLGCRAKIGTVMQLSEIDDIVDTMKLFVEQTKEKIINECNKK